MNIDDVAPLAGYQEPYGLLAAVLQDGTREWRAEMDPNLSVDAIVWQPVPGFHSVGAIILHIIEVEIFWFEKFILGQESSPEEMKLLMSSDIDQDNWTWPVPHREPLSWYFELHDKIRARTLEGLKNWPDPEAHRQLHRNPRTARWVFAHVIQHESYHGGQAVLLNGLWNQRERL